MGFSSSCLGAVLRRLRTNISYLLSISASISTNISKPHFLGLDQRIQKAFAFLLMHYSAQVPWPQRRSVEVLKVVVWTRAWAVQSSELRVCAYHCFSRKEIQLIVFPIVKNAYCGAWSLTLGFFMVFRSLFWWSRAAVAGNSTSPCKGEIPEGTRLRFEFTHKNARSWQRNFRMDCGSKLHFFYLCFSC